MASYHFSIKTSKNSKAPANLHYEYICREGKYENGKKAEELVHKDHGNMPEWAEKDPHAFWRASQIYEAGNRTSYREIELALPNELSKEEQTELTKKFINEHLGNEFVYSYAIHSNEARLAKNLEMAFNEKGEINQPSSNTAPTQNPHVHIMFCERKLDGIPRGEEVFFKRANLKNPELGGAKKDDRWRGAQRSDHLKRMRQSWADMQNEALINHSVTVDHRSLEAQKQDAIVQGDLMKAQELDRLPEQHLGPYGVVQKNNPIRNDVMLFRDYKESIKKVHAEYLHSVSVDKDEKRKVSYDKKESNEFLDKILEKQKELELLQMGTDFSGSESSRMTEEMMKECQERVVAVEAQIYKLRQDHKEVAKKVISPQGAKRIALSVFTYGESTRLNRQIKEVQQEQQKGSKSKEAVAERKAVIEKKLAALLLQVEKPAAKEKLEKIEYNILKKNEPERTKFQKIQEEIKDLAKEKEQLQERMLQMKSSQIAYEMNQLENSKVKVQQELAKRQEAIIFLKGSKDRVASTEKVLETDLVKEMNVTIAHMKEICNTRLQELREQAEPARQEAFEASKKVISSDRAFIMAVSVYTKGQSKAIRKEALKLKDMEEKLLIKERAFKEKPLPGFLQFFYKEEYQKEKEMLESWREELMAKKAVNSEKERALDTKIKKPEVVVRLMEIREQILEKNKGNKETADKLWDKFKAMKEERSQLTEFRKNIQPYEKIPNTQVVVTSPGRAISARDLLRQSNSILGQLKSSNSASNVGLTAKSTEDDETKIKYQL